MRSEERTSVHYSPELGRQETETVPGHLVIYSTKTREGWEKDLEAVSSVSRDLRGCSSASSRAGDRFYQFHDNIKNGQI